MTAEKLHQIGNMCESVIESARHSDIYCQIQRLADTAPYKTLCLAMLFFYEHQPDANLNDLYDMAHMAVVVAHRHAAQIRGAV